MPNWISCLFILSYTCMLSHLLAHFFILAHFLYFHSIRVGRLSHAPKLGCLIHILLAQFLIVEDTLSTFSTISYTFSILSELSYIFSTFRTTLNTDENSLKLQQETKTKNLE